MRRPSRTACTVPLLLLGLIALGSGCRDSADSMEDQVAELCETYTRELGQSYEASSEVAQSIKRLGNRAKDSDVRARGLIRQAYNEIFYGRWQSNWKGKLEIAEELVEDTGTLGDAELLLYRGHMRGKWQGDPAGGLEDLKRGVLILEDLREDETLAEACLHSCELQLFLHQNRSALESAFRALKIAEAKDCEVLIQRSLMRVVQVLELQPNSGSASRPYAQRLEDLGVSEYLTATTLLQTQEDAGQLRRELSLRLTEMKAGGAAGDPEELARLHHTLSSVCRTENDLEPALLHLLEAKRRYREVGNATQVYALSYLAALVRAQLGEADPELEVLVAHAEAAPNRQRSRLLSETFAALGKHEQAAHWRREDERLITSEL